MLIDDYVLIIPLTRLIREENELALILYMEGYFLKVYMLPQRNEYLIVEFQQERQ